jgi:putative ABC transport system substrate-binding protein
VPWFKSRVKCGGKRVDVPAELEGTAADVNQARFAVSRWSSRHFPKVERVLTYPRLIGRDACDGARSSPGLAARQRGRWWRAGKGHFPWLASSVRSLQKGSRAMSLHSVRVCKRRGCGTNVTIEYRWGEGDYGRLPALVAQLLERRPAVIAATGGTPAAAAAKAATNTVPIVFEVGIDPVQTGLVASLNRPEGNLTGVVHTLNGLGPKMLELLREIVPGVGSTAVLINPRFATNRGWATDLQKAAQAVGQRVQIFNASNEAEIAEAFETIRESGSEALLVAEEPFFANQHEQIVGLATRYSLPTVYPGREFAESGGLASYAIDINDTFREAGHYTGRVLKGARPADLPVLQEVKFELILNQKTAKSLGIVFPPTLLARADEVIE